MIVITDKPEQTVVNKSVRPQIITLSSDLSNEQSFRYLLEVKVNDVPVTSLEAAGNPKGVAHFDVNRLSASYLSAQTKQTSNGFSLHYMQNLTSFGTDEFKKFSIVWGEKYLDVNGDVVINTYPLEEYWWFQHNGNFNVFTDSYNDPFFPFSLRNDVQTGLDSQGRFLCTQRVIETYTNAWGVLGCLNVINSTWTAPEPRGEIEKFVYKLFREDGTQIGSNIDLAVTGGAGLPDMNSDVLIDKGVIYIPIQYNNVRNFDEASFDQAAYFTVFAYNSLALGNAVSETIRVNINRPCDDRQYFELGFINRFGSWEYITFTGRNIVGINYDRKDFNKLSGDWGQEQFKTEDVDFGASGGLRSYHVTENISVQLNTGYLTETQAQQIYHLLQSEYVIIFAKKANGGFDSNYIYNGKVEEKAVKIKRTRWDQLIQFTINASFKSADFN